MQRHHLALSSALALCTCRAEAAPGPRAPAPAAAPHAPAAAPHAAGKTQAPVNVDIVPDADGAGAQVNLGFAAAAADAEVSVSGSGGLQCAPSGVVVTARDFAAGEQLALHVAFLGAQPAGDLGVFVRGSFAGLRKAKVVAYRVGAMATPAQRRQAPRAHGADGRPLVLLPATRR